MREQQQSTTPPLPRQTPAGRWPMASGSVQRLTIGPGMRCLQVLAGRVWLTESGRAAAPAVDHWLMAGDAVTLAGGSEVVIEAWGDASFQLLVPPQACAATGGGLVALGEAAGLAAEGARALARSAGSALWRRWRSGLSPRGSLAA